MAECKQAAQTSDVERFNLRKLNELEVRKNYQIEISKRFVALEHLNDSEDINRAWDNIKENIKTLAKESPSLYDLMQLNRRFDEESLGFLDRRKQTKMRWLQDQKRSNVGDKNNVGR